MIEELINNYRSKELFSEEVDLFSLKDIKNDQSRWDYSLPTLVGKKEIKKNLENDDLKGSVDGLLDLDYSNILIAGGFVSNYLLNNVNFSSDIDIFFYGILDKEVARKRLVSLINQIIDNMINKKFSFNCIERNDYVTTLSFRKFDNISYKKTVIKFQIMHRLYKTKSEILHGFDLGSSAVGYDGTNIYFTSLSKFSYLNMVNIVDCSRRSTTYELRLIKYFERGFDIILPKFNISELDNENWVLYKKTSDIVLNDLNENNQMIISYEFIDDSNEKTQKIFVDKIVLKNNSNFSDYEDYVEKFTRNSIHQKIYNILNNKSYTFTGYVKADVENVINGIEKPYVFKSLERYYTKLLNTIIGNNNFPIYLIEKTIKNDVDEIFINRKNENFINDIIIKTLNIVVDYLKKDHSINWIVDNPGTQISSSLNPIIEDDSKWYGKYYKIDYVLV